MSIPPDQRPGILTDFDPRLITERQLAEGPRVLVYETPDDAASAMAKATIGKLAHADSPTMLLATGNTMQPYYRKLIELSRTDRMIHDLLCRTMYWQLDNYVYPPDAYPPGSDATNFSRLLRPAFLPSSGHPG